MTHILISSIFIGFGILGVAQKDAIHVSAGKLEEFVVGTEDDQAHFATTQNTQFICLLEETKLALAKSNLHIIEFFQYNEWWKERRVLGDFSRLE